MSYYAVFTVQECIRLYEELGRATVCVMGMNEILDGRQKMSNKNEVFEYLIDQLRQQVNINQCEDLAHEVQSLKNQLRDASALVTELQETIKLMNEDFNRVTNRGGPLPKGVSYVVGEHGPEQSGCRKEDAHECEHDWVLDEKGDYFVCAKCGEQEAELVDCRHTNTVGLRKGFAPGFTKKCLDCGAKLR